MRGEVVLGALVLMVVALGAWMVLRGMRRGTVEDELRANAQHQRRLAEFAKLKAEGWTAHHQPITSRGAAPPMPGADSPLESVPEPDGALEFVPADAPGKRTNAMAVLALVFAVLLGPVGIIFGHVARAQIKRTGQQGGYLARAALLLGYLALAGLVAFALLLWVTVRATEPIASSPCACA